MEYGCLDWLLKVFSWGSPVCFNLSTYEMSTHLYFTTPQSNKLPEGLMHFRKR